MGKITKIEFQKKNKDKVNLFVDNEFVMGIAAELVYKENLNVGSQISTEKLQSVAKREAIVRCKDSALHIIERSYKTEKQLRDKLIQKGFDEETIEVVIDFVKEYNFINDERYAKAFIKDNIRTKGSKKIKYELIRKGVAKDIIERALKMIDGDEEKENALIIGEKKYKTLIKNDDDTYKISGKLYRFLTMRGYNYDIVKDVVKEIMKS